MNVLSLFDGISCARIALDNLGVRCNYIACEIDPYAVAISAKNYPDIYRYGDVREIGFDGVSGVDLLIGGSPCQDLSIAKSGRKGLAGSRSSLFWVYAKARRNLSPAYFVFENVAGMPDADRQTISAELGVEPIILDARDFSAQNRKRLFWTNIPVADVEPHPQVQRDILDLNADRRWVTDRVYCHTHHRTSYGIKWDTSGKGHFSIQNRAYSLDVQRPCLAASRVSDKTKFLADDGQVGLLTWTEIEALQSLPAGYTDIGVQNRVERRGRAIGNGFNVKVIEHILKGI